MDLRKLTEEQFLQLAEEESKVSINIGSRPHPSAFGTEEPAEVLEMVRRPKLKAAANSVKQKIS